MGESSAPRRPAHDTNTSRREVKKHTHDNNNNNNTSSKQSKYRDTMKITGLIASTLMLLVVFMALKASARSIEFPDQPQKFCCNAISAQCEACKAGVSVEEICRTWVVDSSDPLSFHSRPLDGCPQNQPKPCCRANTLECQACIADVSEEEFCRRKPHSHVCPKKPTKPSHPHNCYSKDLKKEVMHGEMGARNCCWYGDWKKKSKCEKKPSHPHNCYSRMWKKEIMHGEVGPTKCCWYGDWKKKSKCEKKPSHRDNCYSNILKKEVMHGEMGAKKCCWCGDWKRKSKCNGRHRDD